MWKRNRQAGGSLLEILFVVLIVGLLGAAVLTGLRDTLKIPEGQPTITDLPSLEEALAQWTADPETLASADAKAPLASAEDRQAYDAMVRTLQETDQLADWKQLLEARFSSDHPLLTALAEQPTRTEPLAEETEIDPDLTWSDGQPATVLKKKR